MTERCLNCGSTGVRAWCAECGQRHVPAEHYDMGGLVGEYTAQVVSKLKLLRTLWHLAGQPGQLTVDFMEGRRIGQVNPLWLFTFVWSTVVTVSHFFLSTETADLLGDIPPELQQTLATVQPVFMGMIAYSSPLVSVVVGAALARLLFTPRWIEAWVYALHVGTMNLILTAPLAVLMAYVGMWGASSWIAYVTSFASLVPTLAYTALAYRRVFAARVAHPWPRFAGAWLAGALLELGWSMILGVALFVVLVVVQLA